MMMMKSAILTCFVSSAVSQVASRAPHCASYKALGSCIAARACTWCVDSCYSKPFAKSFPSGAWRCASTTDVGGKDGAPNFPDVQASSKYILDRRTMGAILGAGVLSVPFGFPSGARAASDITLSSFDREGVRLRSWNVMLGPADDPIKKGELKFSGSLGKTLRGTLEKALVQSKGTKNVFPDVSSCEGITFSAKNTNTLRARQPIELGGKEIIKEVPVYTGYSISIGRNGGRIGGLAYGYKAKFDPPLNEFGVVKIPFKDFTNSWDENTGEPIKTCAESPENCLDEATLQNMQQISFLAIGQTGTYNLAVEGGIQAYGCTAAPQLATVDEAGGINFSSLLAVVSLGLLASVVARARRRTTATAPPLLG